VGENLKKFIDLYSAKADDRLKSAEARLEAFKKARESAVALTLPLDGDYSTLGGLVAKMFPEKGGIDNSLFSNVYSQLTLEKEDREPIQKVFKLRNAPIVHEEALKIKSISGEKYFNDVISSLTSSMLEARSLGAKIDFSSLLGKTGKKSSEDNLEDFGDGVQSLLSDTNMPYVGLFGSAELFSAVDEFVTQNGDPVLASKSESSPINPNAETFASSESSSPINATEGEKGKDVGSTINPEKKTAEAETEKAAVLGSAPEVPEETKPFANVPEVTVKVEAASPNVTVKVEAASPNVTVTQTPNTTPGLSNLAPSPVNETKVENTAVTSNSSSSSTTINPAAAAAPSGTESTTNVYQKYLGNEITNEMADALFSTPVSTTVASTSSTINSLNTSANSSKTSSEKVDTSTLNENQSESMVKETTSNNVGEYIDSQAIQQYLGFTMADLKNEKSAKTSDTSVTKTNSSLPLKKEELAKSESVNSATSETTEKPTSQVTLTPVESEERSVGAMQQTATAQPAQSISFDVSDLEARLGRIELLLTGTLDVKIVES